MQKISLKQKNNKLSIKAKTIIIILIVVISALVAGYWYFLNNYHEWTSTVVAPTCTEKGYTQYTCKYCNQIKRTRYTAALGHDYGETVLKTEATETDFGKRAKVCKRCKKEEAYLIEPTSKMKKFYFVGDTFGVDSNMTTSGVMTYSYSGKKDESYVYLKYTDGNTTRYAKHNFTVTFFNDSDKTSKKEVQLNSTDGKSSCWCLAGNYYDFENRRSSVADSLFRQIRSTSKSIDERLGENYGTVESEPVLLYLNNTFAGVYRLYKSVDNRTFNAEKSEMLAVVRTAYASRESLFKKTTDDTGPWSIIYNYLSDEDGEKENEEKENQEAWIYDSLNALIDFVAEKEGDEFKKGISAYLDVDGMIDYMVTVYNICAANNVGKYFTLATYDGKVWTPSLYNASASFGLNNHGEITDLETTLVPSEKDGEIDSDTASLLWDKMFGSFYKEISERYNETKDTVFSAENIINEFKKYSTLGEAVLNKEKESFKQVDSETDISDNINSFISSRRKLLGEFLKK